MLIFVVFNNTVPCFFRKGTITRGNRYPIKESIFNTVLHMPGTPISDSVLRVGVTYITLM